ncbi:MAG: hypothetical protein LBP83_04390 [Dysgonamonadaceae bacterium]|jgi:hypothetical protein|nr:hypothetical protein [Dysgonamonadaceae bacterium]
MGRFILTVILLAQFVFISYSQNSEIKLDSLSNDTVSRRVQAEYSLFKEKPDIRPSISPDLFPDSFSLSPSMKINYISLPLYYFDSEYLTISPFSFNYYDWREGGDVVGINNAFKLNDYFWGNINFSISSSYVGYLQPNRYNNASISLQTVLQPNEKIRLTAFGQISLREGINPLLQPTINGGNYYGIDLQFKIYKNMGIGIRFMNSYYRNNWNSFKYVTPVLNEW